MEPQRLMLDRDAFLRWHCSNPLAEELREAYLHWLVLHALGLDPGTARADGIGSEQLLWFGDLSLALASAAYFQHPAQQDPSPISFKLTALQADAQLLGLLEGSPPSTLEGLDLFDPDQWRFWVVPSRALHAERLSIGLNPLRRAQGDGVLLADLQTAVRRLAHDKPPVVTV